MKLFILRSFFVFMCYFFSLFNENFFSTTLIAQDQNQELKEEPSNNSEEELELKKPSTGSQDLEEGVELVNMDFPELTDIKDIIKAVALWTGKNVILDRNVTGKIQIISPAKVTKEEAYQAFLSALNMLGLTTVETGKVIKILKHRTAVKGNLKTYQGNTWAPRTDEIITQIIPLKYIDAKQVQSTLSRIVSPNSLIAYEPTNTLIISDSGYQVGRVLETLALLDVQTQQPKVMIVPIKYSDPKSVASKVKEILKGTGGSASSGYNSFKILTDDRTNSIIIFGPPRTIKDVKQLVKTFDIEVNDSSVQATIHVRPLDFADAAKLSSTLSSLASGKSKSSSSSRRPPSSKRRTNSSDSSSTASVADLGDGVKISSDEATNSLLITGSKEAYDTLNSIIRKLDVRRSQVYVEADILDINEDNGLNAGMSIFAGTKGAGNNSPKSIIGWEGAGMQSLVVATSSANTGTISTSTATDIARTFSENLTIAVLSGKSVDVPGLGKFTPGGLINLIKSDSNSRILSSPQILTSNNEEANITVGEKVFFQTQSMNATTGAIATKVESENVDLTLSIKPSISYSNYVTLDVKLESNFVKSLNSQGVPQVAKRKTKQLVTLKNGQTVVISGLLSNTDLESYKKIPLLGDIPLLGWIFRNSTKSSRRSNLMIFITPHVVHGAADLAAIYKAKISERDSFLESVYGSGSLNDEFYDLIPKESDGIYKEEEKGQSNSQSSLEKQLDSQESVRVKMKQDSVVKKVKSTDNKS